MTELDHRRRAVLHRLAGLTGLSLGWGGSMPSRAAGSGAVANARVHALVVGCGRYPSLSAARQLPGAEADARLWARTLMDHHRDQLLLQVLSSADASSPPTQRAILRGLDRMIEQVGAGETAWIVFAGHGTQTPQRLKSRYAEPDGWDELFLPLDCGRWMEPSGEVARAIRDNDIHDRLLALHERGAHVVAVFDTCHAAGMDRNSSVTQGQSRERSVGLNELGGPVKTTASTRAELSAARSPEPRDLQALTLLYACRKHERTREGWVVDARGRRLQHGFFSWHFIHAWSELKRLESGVDMAALSNAVLERYRRDDIVGAVPQLLGAQLPTGTG